MNIATLPQETQQVYESKGRLLRDIEELNRVAKIAFWNRKEIAGLFNKDVINRARKSRSPSAAEPTPSAG